MSESERELDEPGGQERPSGGGEAPATPEGEPRIRAGGTEHEPVPAPGNPPEHGPVRRLYEWMLGWADTRHGPAALAGISFAESSVFPIPPDPLLMALCLGAPKKALRFAAITTLASVLGGVLGYGIGALAWEAVGPWFLAHVPGVDAAGFDAVQDLYTRWGFWAVCIAGLTPIPYKVFTLASGVFAIGFPIFLGASIFSRGLRFFVVAGLIRAFGEPIARFIDRYFNLLTWVFVALLIGGFLLIEVVL